MEENPILKQLRHFNCIAYGKQTKATALICVDGNYNHLSRYPLSLFQRTNEMGHPQFYYLDFTYAFAGKNPNVSNLDAISAKSLILANLKTFFGDSAAGVGFDLLVFRPAAKRGVIRCPASSFVKLRASMTLPAAIDEETVSFTTVKASPLLTSLLANSRSYEHKNYLTAKRKLRIESYSEEEMDTDGS